MFFFFFNDTATTEIYTLSLHDALPISRSFSGALEPDTAVNISPAAPVRPTGRTGRADSGSGQARFVASSDGRSPAIDRKSTRLNSSHANISYAVFCLKKKKKTTLLYDF